VAAGEIEGSRESRRFACARPEPGRAPGL